MKQVDAVKTKKQRDQVTLRLRRLWWNCGCNIDYVHVSRVKPLPEDVNTYYGGSTRRCKSPKHFYPIFDHILISTT